jgi:hypothetical protein
MVQFVPGRRADAGAALSETSEAYTLKPADGVCQLNPELAGRVAQLALERSAAAATLRISAAIDSHSKIVGLLTSLAKIATS